MTPKEITPDEALDALQTLPRKTVHGAFGWKPDWITSEEYMQWAKRGMDEDDSYGFSTCIMYANRAVSRRVDYMLHRNHMYPLLKCDNDEKVIALKQIGIEIPPIIGELVTELRNKLEHHYYRASRQDAQHAFDLATLILLRTDEEASGYRTLAINWQFGYTSQIAADGREKVTISSLNQPDDVAFFIDLFEEPWRAKVLDFPNAEIRYADIGKFSKDQSIQLAKQLRKNGPSCHTDPDSVYRELKRLGGI